MKMSHNTVSDSSLYACTFSQTIIVMENTVNKIFLFILQPEEYKEYATLLKVPKTQPSGNVSEAKAFHKTEVRI